MLLYYIRHGRPTYNPDQLTPAGKRQAEAIAKRLGVFGVDKIYASSSNRAIETAQPTSEICEKEITVLDWLSEGWAWQYTTVPNAEGDYAWGYQNPLLREKFVSGEVLALGYNWYDHPFFASYPQFKDGISFIDSHVDELLASFGYIHNRDGHFYTETATNNERIAIFAHEGMSKLFLSSLLDIPYPLFATRMDISYTGLTVIEFSPDKITGKVIPEILTFGNDGHLYREGLPTLHNCRIRY